MLYKKVGDTMTTRYPWRGNTSQNTADQDDPRYETPGGAQHKVDTHVNVTVNIANKAITQPKIADWAVGARQIDPSLLEHYGDIATNAKFDVIDDQLADIAYNVKNFGASGDGVSNDTLAIKTTIDQAPDGSTILFPSGTYIVDPIAIRGKAGIDIFQRNNLTLLFSNATIKSKTTNVEGYNIINIEQSNNIYLKQPKVIGDKDTHIGTSGEFGQGINIINSDGTRIDQPDVSKTWGDGIYIGVDYFGTSGIQSGSTYLRNVRIDDCSRNGIAVCSGKYIEIDGAEISNILRVNPKTAIDIEPEGEGSPAPILEKLVIKNLRTSNCGAGVTYLLPNLIGKNTDITIINHNDTGSTNAIVGFNVDGDVYGKVDIIDSYYRDNYQHGVIIYDNHVTSLKITFTDLVIENCNVQNSSDVNIGSPVLLVAGSELTNSKPMGNIDFINPRFIDTRTPERMFAPIVAYSLKPNNTTLDKINIIDIKDIEYSKKYLQIIGKFNCVDQFKQLEVSNTTNPVDINIQNYRKKYDNKGAVEGINFNLNSNIPVGQDVRIEMVDNHSIAVVPDATSSILPLATTGKYILANTVGSSVTLRKISNTQWIIVNIVGTWTVET